MRDSVWWVCGDIPIRPAANEKSAVLQGYRDISIHGFIHMAGLLLLNEVRQGLGIMDWGSANWFIQKSILDVILSKRKAT